MVSLSLFRRKKSPSKSKAPAPPQKKSTPAKSPVSASSASPASPVFPDKPQKLPTLPNISASPASPSPPLQNRSFPSLVEDYPDSVAVSSTASQDTKLRPPVLNGSPLGISSVSSAPASPHRDRSGSSASRRPRASFVRHSRVLSGTSTIQGGLNSMFSPSQSLRNRQMSIITDLPAELSPVVNLTNAQRLREYVSGTIGILNEDGSAWLTAEATLTGTELSIWVLGYTKPRYLNIQDCSIVASRDAVPGDDQLHDLLVFQDYDFNVTSLRFGDAIDMHMWLAAMQLSKFEYTSLSEAFTAVVLSLKGPKLSDIYTLLAHKKRFTRFEWCNLRLPQVSNKWIKVFMAIIPADGKRSGRVEMYTSDKMSKKNLILYVNNVSSVYNVYPEDHHMIEINSMMKLEGEAFVNRSFEYLFSGLTAPNSPKARSRPSSIASFASLNPPAPAKAVGTRSRSTSLNSSSSFFTHAPSPTPEKPASNKGSPKMKSTHFFKKQAVNNFVTTNYLYLMPEAHPGVSAIEIMLRNFVHIMDTFRLYGRPDHLNSNKENPVSMLFGLPALPHYGYLDIEDAYGVVAANFDTARLQNWGQGQWRSCLKEYLRCKQKDGPFKGFGNIYELFNSVDVDGDHSSIGDGVISPIPTKSKAQGPQRGPSPSKLRDLQSYDDFQRLVDDGDSSHYSDEHANGNGLGKPIDFNGGRDGNQYGNQYGNQQGNQYGNLYGNQHENQNGNYGGYYSPPNGANGRYEAGGRSLHPIMDLPTPIDDTHGQSYFSKEGQIKIQS